MASLGLFALFYQNVVHLGQSVLSVYLDQNVVEIACMRVQNTLASLVSFPALSGASESSY